MPAGATAIPAELLRQVRRIELFSRRLVDSMFAGAYRAVFKGQGVEFAEVREYSAGDEVRSIDWNVTARMGRPFVKKYVEERELTVVLAVDLSGSIWFGSVRQLKATMAVELAAVLALAAARNNDRTGLLLFSDRIEHFVPPRKGRRQALRIVRDLLAWRPQGVGTDLGGALEYLRRLLAHRSVVFLLSDLLANGAERALKLLVQRHDVIVATIEDPAEWVLPDVGFARMRDAETGEIVEVDTSHPAVRRAFQQRSAAEREARTRMLRRLGVDEIVCRTDHGYVDPLHRFFRARGERARRR
ncbi:MAG TPA: DUF58 domain-containing protein [Gemmatimonadaceae bacterium]|nr:DUF58 domain-containing protein [Gemmatimonadaceae bacterium]